MNHRGVHLPEGVVMVTPRRGRVVEHDDVLTPLLVEYDVLRIVDRSERV